MSRSRDRRSADAAPEATDLHLATRRGRWVVVACVLGSGLAGIDATVVNIALPAIGRDLHAGFAALQWTVTAYTLTLASLILLGGSLGDRYGRRRVFVLGVVWFAVASVACAAAPDATLLVLARALQGVGAALLTPASLAVLEASFVADDRAAAIGVWSAFSGITTAIAPFLGGWLIQAASWRWVFVINPVVAVAVIAVAMRHMPESRDPAAPPGLDLAGSALAVAGLAGLTYPIIAAGTHPVTSVTVWLPALGGLLAAAAFAVVERRSSHPLLPAVLLRSALFVAANAVTLLIYAATAGSLFLLVIELQTVSGFGPLLAGAALLPITVVMLALASRFGRLAQQHGPRLFMALGPLVTAAGLAMLTSLTPTSTYARDVLPAMTVFGLGLAVFVAPLTATVLGAVPAGLAGVASGVNNAVARAAGLIAVATLPVVTGLSGDHAETPGAFLAGFRVAMWLCVGLLVGGAILAALTIRRPGPGHSIRTYPAVCANPIASPTAPARSRPQSAAAGPVTGSGRATRSGHRG